MDALLSTAIKAGVASAIGAVVTLLIERAWKRHKGRQQAKSEKQS